MLPFAFWIACEAWCPKVFVWMLGHTQQSFPSMVQSADIGGCSLISALTLWGSAIPLLFLECYFPGIYTRWFAGSNALSSHVLTKKDGHVVGRLTSIHRIGERIHPKWHLAAVVSILAANLVYGYASINLWNKRIEKLKAYRIGVIQEDPSFNHSISKMKAASDALIDRVDLLCWPESTLGSHSTDIVSFLDRDAVATSSLPPPIDPTPITELEKPLIVGGRSFDGLPKESIPQHQTAYVVIPSAK